MNKLLRVDFVRDVMNIKLVTGDEYINEHGSTWTVTTSNPSTWATSGVSIISFTPRHNEGVQPVVSDMVVNVMLQDGETYAVEADVVEWYISAIDHIDVSFWKPNYDALLKMQHEHDIVKLINDCKAELLVQGDETVVGYYNDTGVVKSHVDFGHHSYNDICTVSEFNQCVDEMSKAEWLNPVETERLIYTKEMCDARTPLTSGMLFNNRCGEYIVISTGTAVDGSLIATIQPTNSASTSGIKFVGNPCPFMQPIEEMLSAEEVAKVEQFEACLATAMSVVTEEFKSVVSVVNKEYESVVGVVINALQENGHLASIMECDDNE